eukprot:scaffold358_cov343-Pavlova_lutheri.AAC.35
MPGLCCSKHIHVPVHGKICHSLLKDNLVDLFLRDPPTMHVFKQALGQGRTEYDLCRGLKVGASFLSRLEVDCRSNGLQRTLSCDR